MNNNLPDDIKNIIFNYYNQLEHSYKFKKCLDEIKQINIFIEKLDYPDYCLGWVNDFSDECYCPHCN